MATDGITGGHVLVEDGRKSAEEYTPARKVAVMLTFGVTDSEDPAIKLRIVGKLASDHVALLLSGVAPAAVETAAAEQAPAAEKKTRARKETADPMAAAPQAEAPVVDPMAGGQTVNPTVDPMASGTPAAAVDPFAVPAADAAPITDDDLNGSLQKKAADLGSEAGTVKIRELIATYNPDPTKGFSASLIPQAQRQDFLTKLEAITL